MSCEAGVESSVPVNEKLGECVGLGLFGLMVIPVSGGARSGASSTFHDRIAGVASTLPAASFARTFSEWSPTLRLEYVFGEAQALNAASSSEHSNVAAASFEENANVALVPDTVPDGPLSMVVAGGLVSGAANRITSSGRFIALSRLATCCSEPPLLSPASLIRKPLFALAYIATTWADTFQSRQPAVAVGPRPDIVLTASPVV